MVGLTRTIVNLLLIVAMTSQSVIVCASSGDCSGSCAAPFKCQDCSCCAVKNSDDRCGCCRDRSSNGQDTGNGHCGILEATQAEDTTNSAILRQPSMRSAGELDSYSSCTCRQNPTSQFPLQPPSSLNETVQFVPLNIPYSDSTSAKPCLPGVLRSGVAPHSDVAHFAQFSLCVWRL